MNPPRILCWRLALPLLLTARVLAHEPFDLSTRISVAEDIIVLDATWGVDAAREVLALGGLSREQVTRSLRALGPDDAIEQPGSVASAGFRLQIEGQELAPQRVTTRSEGMEIYVAATYSRPSGNRLTVRAIAYDQIKALRTGSVIVTAEAGGTLGAALLSAGKSELVVDLRRPVLAPHDSSHPPRATAPADATGAAPEPRQARLPRQVALGLSAAAILGAAYWRWRKRAGR